MMPKKSGGDVVGQANVTAEAVVRVVRRPPPLHREVTAVNSMIEVTALVAQGWKIVDCRLEREVVVDVVEVKRLLPRKVAPPLEAEPA